MSAGVLRRFTVLPSRNGIISISPRSLGSPCHGGMITALSGCKAACSGLLSIKITFSKGLLRNDRSYCNQSRDCNCLARAHLYYFAVHIARCLAVKAVGESRLEWV